MNMDEEDDLPPMLVTADGSDHVEAGLTAEMEDARVTKVPITIITGMYA